MVTSTNGATTVGIVTTTSSVRQLSDGNGFNGGPGTQLGQNAQDEIGFYGANPVVQPSGPGQAAIVRGQQSGSAAVIKSSSLSPAAVANATTAENGLTLMAGNGPSWNIAAGDVLYINKPTSQAGLGVGNVRISAAGVAGVTFSNFTAATITPTATQSYGVVAVRGMPVLSPVLSPVAVAPNTTSEQIFTVAGIRSGPTAMAQVMKPTSQAGLDIVGVRLVSSNTLGITFANITSATITPTASETYTVLEMAGLDALNNTMLIEETLSLTASSNAVASASQAATVTGLAVTDAVMGVTKPTAQANFGIVGAFVSAANTLGITIANFAAATVTPTASDVYGIGIYRPNPVAPLVVYNQTLSPVSVAANTTAEQSFNITGLVAGSVAWVNKPSWTLGLGIAGVRVSAANTLAITFCNATSAAITPPSEAYVIGNFQIPLGDAGSEWVQSVVPAVQTAVILTNSLRSSLVNEGLIAGA